MSIESCLDDLEKIEYHPYSPDDGHYDYGFDYEQSSQFMDKHIKTVRLVLKSHQELVAAVTAAEKMISVEDKLFGDIDPQLGSVLQMLRTAIAKAKADQIEEAPNA